MTEPEDLDEDLFADLYVLALDLLPAFFGVLRDLELFKLTKDFYPRYEGDEPTTSKPAEAPAPVVAPKNEPEVKPEVVSAAVVEPAVKTESLFNTANFDANLPEPQLYGEEIYGNHNIDNGGSAPKYEDEMAPRVKTDQGFTGTVGIKEDG